ncbi:MAG: iron-sulfur cluster-binding domain-containing protein [Clostridia bacterium]
MEKFNFHLKFLGLLDMLHFKEIVPDRRAQMASGSTENINNTFGVNNLAKSMHPNNQNVVISEIIEHKDAKTFVFTADKLAIFRAGQYVSVKLNIGKTFTTRAYSISSSPKWVKEGKYAITVKQAANSFVSEYILKNWKVGEKVSLSGPEGNFYYEAIRDEKNVLAIAGGSGITPFLSMAYAIRDGIEDFNLTILFGSRKESDILFKDEFDKITKECNKVNVVYVLSEEKNDAYENGFINEKIINKYANAPFSVFLCGPKAMYDFASKELEKMKIDKKHIRQELLTPPASPNAFDKYKGDSKAIYKLNVIIYGEEKTIDMRADEPILVAIERAGLKTPSRCRSGECGCCRSRLISGDVFIPDSTDGRRIADIQNGFIHTCCSWALSDIKIEVLKDKE